MADQPFELPLSFEEFMQVMQDVELTSIYLVRSNAQMFDRQTIDADPTAVRLRMNGDATFTNFQEDDAHRVAVSQVFNVSLIGKEDKKLVQLAVDYAVIYETGKPWTPEFFEMFKHLTLPTHTLPFIREWISSETSRMQIPTVLIPILKATVELPVPARQTLEHAADKKKKKVK